MKKTMMVLINGTIKSHILYEISKMQREVTPLYINHKRCTDCEKIKRIYPDVIIDNSLNLSLLDEEDFKLTKHLFFQVVSSLYGDKALVGISLNHGLPYELSPQYSSPFLTMTDLDIVREFVKSGVPVREIQRVNPCSCNSCKQCFIRFYTFSFFGIRVPLFGNIEAAYEFMNKYEGRDLHAIKKAVRLLKKPAIKKELIHWDFAVNEDSFEPDEPFDSEE